MATSGYSGKRQELVAQEGSKKAGETAPSGQRIVAKDAGRFRAKVAWGWVTAAEARFPKEKERKRYGTLARKLPTYLQVSGLGQTLAFLFSKGERDKDKPESLLLSQLSDHLRSRLSPPPTGEIMSAILELSPAAYRTATREALAIADWLKRFAEGRLDAEEE